jgi:Flp pilus assembly pilin Flp
MTNMGARLLRRRVTFGPAGGRAEPSTGWRICTELRDGWNRRRRALVEQLSRPHPGQTNVEYAFILFIVAIATVVLLIALAGGTNTLLASVNSTLGS